MDDFQSVRVLGNDNDTVITLISIPDNLVFETCDSDNPEYYVGTLAEDKFVTPDYEYDVEAADGQDYVLLEAACKPSYSRFESILDNGEKRKFTTHYLKIKARVDKIITLKQNYQPAYDN